nr:glycine-rich protein-like [Ipomoea batatas]
MSSKVVVLLGLSLVVFVMIASEVTAREMAETTTTSFNRKFNILAVQQQKLRKQMGLLEMTSTMAVEGGANTVVAAIATTADAVCAAHTRGRPWRMQPSLKQSLIANVPWDWPLGPKADLKATRPSSAFGPKQPRSSSVLDLK